MKTILLATILVGACGVEQLDTDEPVQGAEPWKIGANGLLPGKIQGSTLGTAALTPAALTASGMMNSSDGRDFASYLIGCALTPSQSITAQQQAFPYTAYTFTGAIGLGTEWTRSALTTSDRKWVSACVLARVNYYGQSVTISLQGNNTALAIDFDQDYHIDEGAFWGDILAGGVTEHSCMGVDQAHDNTQGDLPLRKCAAGSSWCAFTDHGLCTSACTGSVFPYSNCAVTFPAQNLEVISVKLYGNPD
jgi:hypothetical protein